MEDEKKTQEKNKDTFITLAKIKIMRDGGRKKHLAPSGNEKKSVCSLATSGNETREKKNRCASFGAKRKLNTEEKKIGVCHLAPSGNKHGRKKTKKISALHTAELSFPP